MKKTGLRDIAGMAFRNLGRHRVKTIITTAAVAISVTLYIFMDGWLLGMNLESRRNIVSYEIGCAKIQSDAYFARKDDLPMYESFDEWEGISEALAATGYDAAPRFVFSGSLYSRSGTAPLVFNAVDPDAERRLLRYPSYLEAGRFPVTGRLELAVGSLVAEKLHIGIPLRPTRTEFETELLGAARNEEEAAFVRSLYAPLPKKRGGSAKLFSVASAAAGSDEEELLALEVEPGAAEIGRFWGILSAAGRMDVRLSTVIDSKAAPDAIRKGKFENELLPALSPEGRRLALLAYAADSASGDYRLAASDPGTVEAALRAMLDAEFPLAVRHVNQLIDAVVVGVVNSPNPKTNGNVAYIPLDALQDEAGLMLEGRITELLLRAAGADDAALPGRTEEPAAIRAALASRGAAIPEGLSVHGWKDYVADYLAAAAGDNVSTRVMIILLFLLSFIGIANTMLMAILERTKETGMLRALGMTDAQLILTYAIEAGLVGLLGSVVGIVLGCLVNIPMVAYGIDYSALSKEMGGDFGYRVVAFFRSAWNPPTIIGSGIVATLLSALTAIPPTLRALRMPVTESLRFE